MGLCEGAKTKVGVDYELSEEFEDKVGCTNDLSCHLFFLHWLWMLSPNLQERVR